MASPSAMATVRQTISISSNGKGAMFPRSYPATAFLLTGFTWLVMSSILGLAILIGLVRGTPLPSWIRLIHVHAALVGGVAQMILGGFLAFIPPLLMTGQKQRESHPALFFVINSAAIGMAAGFWLRQYVVVGLAGFLVVGAFMWIARDAWTQARRSVNPPPLNLWYYAAALLSLFAGLAAGEAMAWGLLPESYGYVRLAHIHLNLIGFVTLAIIGTMHNLLPTVLNAPLSSPKLGRLVLLLMPVGVVALVTGFMNSSLRIELAAGALLLIGVSLYAANLFKTWMRSAHRGNAASDHLLIGTFFLWLTILLGILVAANSLSTPPLMPYGTLHLVAYTHMALVGFIVNTIVGALSHLLPITLAVRRVPSNKKRGPYLDQLSAIMDRWRTVQIGGLSFGTMGLALLASLTWNMPLSSLPIHITMWVCFALLLGSLVLFAAKLSHVLTTQPSE
jgi:hypothetical protein